MYNNLHENSIRQQKTKPPNTFLFCGFIADILLADTYIIAASFLFVKMVSHMLTRRGYAVGASVSHGVIGDRQEHYSRRKNKDRRECHSHRPMSKFVYPLPRAGFHRLQWHYKFFWSLTTFAVLVLRIAFSLVSNREHLIRWDMIGISP